MEEKIIDKKFIIKTIIKYVLSILGVIVTLWAVQRILVPKYNEGGKDPVEGRYIQEYYNEKMNHDVLFIGDCEVYENFSPQVLWEEYGINSYIRGSAQQLIWQSYYLLEDSLRYEKPKVVVFNVLSMKYNEPQKEGYNRMSIDGMKWSKSKIDNINASMCEDEKFIEYVFPLLRYHSRWSELTKDDFKYAFSQPETKLYSGYYMRVDVRPLKEPPVNPLPDYQFGDTAYEYLEKLTKLCKDNDIELVLIKAPCPRPYWYKQWNDQIEEFANNNDLLYINLLDYVDEIGLDFNYDTYDEGLHLNLSGATKLSHFFGQYLMDNCKLKDMRGDKELDEIWQKKGEAYYKEIERQKKALEESLEE